MINHTGTAANEVYKGKSTLAINQDFSELINGLKLRVQGAYDIHSHFNADSYTHLTLPTNRAV